MLLYSRQLKCELRLVSLSQQTQSRREEAGSHLQRVGVFVWEQKQRETTYHCNNTNITKPLNITALHNNTWPKILIMGVLILQEK